MPVTDLHTVNLVSFTLNNLGIMMNIIMEFITTFSLGVAGDENITHNGIPLFHSFLLCYIQTNLLMIAERECWTFWPHLTKWIVFRLKLSSASWRSQYQKLWWWQRCGASIIKVYRMRLASSLLIGILDSLRWIFLTLFYFLSGNWKG